MALHHKGLQCLGKMLTEIQELLEMLGQRLESFLLYGCRAGSLIEHEVFTEETQQAMDLRN